jgi:plastocyanin
MEPSAPPTLRADRRKEAIRMMASPSRMHASGLVAVLFILALSLFLAACSTAATPTPTTAPGTPTEVPSDSNRVTVTMTDTGFDPQTVTISVGMSVLWSNQAIGGHSVVFVGFESWRLAHGEFYNHAFGTPGTYEYHCGDHPSETGTIIVK